MVACSFRDKEKKNRRGREDVIKYNRTRACRNFKINIQGKDVNNEEKVKPNDSLQLFKWLRLKDVMFCAPQGSQRVSATPLDASLRITVVGLHYLICLA